MSPPVNATSAPYLVAFLATNSVARQAPWENPRIAIIPRNSRRDRTPNDFS